MLVESRNGIPLNKESFYETERIISEAVQKGQHIYHTEQEIKWIKDYHRRNPNISLDELYGKLREEKAYSRHPGSLYCVFVRLGFRKKVESTKKKSKHVYLSMM